MIANEFRAWLVDLDGTLYVQRPVRWAMACELLMFGWPALRVVTQFRREQEALRREPLGGDEPAADSSVPYDLQINRTASRLKIPREQVLSLMETWMQRRPGKWLWLFRRRRLLAEITQFRRQGGKTALVSDYPAAAKLAALRAETLVDVVVANGEPGGPSHLKPSPQGFLLAAARLGISPQQCLVIGDRDDADGQAAQRAGMTFRKIAS